MSATRFMNALGKRRIKGDKVDMEVEYKKLEPNLKQGSANDPVEPDKPQTELSQLPDVQGMTRGSATDILKKIQKANKTK